MRIVIGFILLFFMIFSFKSKEEKNSYIQQDSKLLQSIKRGKEVYLDMCVTCHLPNGEGKRKIYPPLAKSDYLMEKREESIKAIKYGLKGKIIVNGVTYKRRMSKPGLDNDEIADVMNYITNSWGNKSDTIITEKEVENISKD
ncbi:cytochrome c [Polaribacter aestuariivivens]|uniref:Cytochrome c n=1 Tax=Polaribacter aestuariivivens TaxID=2304626 RepID=A0A5S3N8A3_9FLAO|nr:cytochrome c [Polaribacter aestuariivivens]TMM29066.1 cytochrome c [Polaribacter aestuariivivens]